MAAFHLAVADQKTRRSSVKPDTSAAASNQTHRKIFFFFQKLCGAERHQLIMKKTRGLLLTAGMVFLIGFCLVRSVLAGEYALVLLDCPDAMATFPFGISEGRIVGGYEDAAGQQHAFLYDSGIWTTLDYPGAIATFAYAIDGNTIAGGYWDEDFAGHGFTYDGNSWTSIDYPGATLTGVWGIDGNSIVGFYFDTDNVSHGFVFDGTVWTALDFPGATGTSACGIDGNRIIGFYLDARGQSHGFLYDGTDWTVLDFPGASSGGALGIDGAAVVGSFDNDSSTQGYIFDGAAWASFDYPGARRTFARGVSADIVVGYSLGADGFHGFIAYPATDLDGDGIADSNDQCPDSDLLSTVMIGECDSGVENRLFSGGCTIADAVALCSQKAQNHGEFVSQIAQLSSYLQKSGFITAEEENSLGICADQADIP